MLNKRGVSNREMEAKFYLVLVMYFDIFGKNLILSPNINKRGVSNKGMEAVFFQSNK